jgi:hypothetical protein
MALLLIIGIIYLATKNVNLTEDDYGYTFKNDNQ